ncbi:ring finger domain protein, partial [Puccinia sorghi]
ITAAAVWLQGAGEKERKKETGSYLNEWWYIEYQDGRTIYYYGCGKKKCDDVPGERALLVLAVWCCADTLVVRALPPSPVQCHEEPAVSSGNPFMGALQVVTLPDHQYHPHDLSTPDRLKQPVTSIRVNPVTISDPLHPVISGGVIPCNSPAVCMQSVRTEDGDDERWEEGRKQEGLEKGSISAGGAHDSVAIDVRESVEEDGEGTGSTDVAADQCAVCLEEIGAEGGAEGASTIHSWNGCGHRFHTACVRNVPRCPLCRCSHNGVAAPVLPGRRTLISRPLVYQLTCGGSMFGVAAWSTSLGALTYLVAYLVLRMFGTTLCFRC